MELISSVFEFAATSHSSRSQLHDTSIIALIKFLKTQHNDNSVNTRQ